MGRYFNTAEDVERVTFPDGQWVDLRKELPVDVSDKLLRTLANLNLDGGEAKTSITFSRLGLLEAYVVAWSFEEEPGKAIPVDSDHLSNLKVQYRVKVLEGIYRLQRESREWSEKN